MSDVIEEVRQRSPVQSLSRVSRRRSSPPVSDSDILPPSEHDSGTAAVHLGDIVPYCASPPISTPSIPHAPSDSVLDFVSVPPHASSLPKQSFGLVFHRWRRRATAALETKIGFGQKLFQALQDSIFPQFGPSTFQYFNLPHNYLCRTKIMIFGFIVALFSEGVVRFDVLELEEGISGRWTLYMFRRWLAGRDFSKGSFMVKIWDPGERIWAQISG